MDTLIPEKVYQ